MQISATPSSSLQSDLVAQQLEHRHRAEQEQLRSELQRLQGQLRLQEQQAALQQQRQQGELQRLAADFDLVKAQQMATQGVQAEVAQLRREHVQAQVGDLQHRTLCCWWDVPLYMPLYMGL